MRPGWWNFQTIFFWAKSLPILALSHAYMNDLSSLAAPTNSFRCHWWWCSGSHVLKWILSLQPDMTRCLMDCATSMCTALVVRQVKRQNHFFKVRRRNFTSKCRTRSTPVRVNGNICSSGRSRGRCVIGGRIGLASLCPHLKHLVLIFLNAFLNPMIQYFCWSTFRTYSAPSCRLSRWTLSNRRCMTGCFAVNNIGCFAL